MPLKDGPGLRLPLPNVAFWTDKKLAQIGAFKPPKRWLRHTETPCHWRVDLAFGLQLPLPNNWQWTRSKLEPSSLRPVWLRHTETPCHWRTDQACGCLCLTSLSELTRNYSSKLKPSNLRHVWLRHTETQCHWRTDLCQQPPSLQNAGFAACFSMSCWLLTLASCLLPLASYSFLCFLSSCSISCPLFSDALPLLSAGVGR